MNKKVISVLNIILIYFLVLSCDSLKNDAEKRASIAEKSKGDIIIGAVAPWASMKELLWPGIELAVSQINEGGGVLGRQIRIVKEDDDASVVKGRMIAQNFSENLEMVAVIGHFNSYISIPASATYEFSGLLMISPYSTAPKLTEQGYKLLFRSIPSDAEVARQIADFAYAQKYKKIIIYYINTSYGLGLANSFERRSEETEDMEIVERISYDPTERNESLRSTIRNWKDIEFDAIFLAGEVPKAGKIIAEIRKLGMTNPILGGDGLDSSELWEVGGEAAEGTIAASFFDPQDSREKVQNFIKSFEKKNEVTPDLWAVQGYDAVNLLAYAMKKAGSSAPDKVAAVLRSTKDWKGVAGNYTFDDKGDMVNPRIVLKEVQNSKFVVIN